MADLKLVLFGLLMLLGASAFGREVRTVLIVSIDALHPAALKTQASPAV